MINKVFLWKQPLGKPECPYAYRWMINFGLFSVRLHKWLASDDLRAKHDHPSWFITIVLKGRYIDRNNIKDETLKRGSIRFRRATYQHSVEIINNPTWTLLIFGPDTRKWFFYPNGKPLRREKYFKRYGHHPCSAFSTDMEDYQQINNSSDYVKQFAGANNDKSRFGKTKGA